MQELDYNKLSKRERQIMDAIHELKEASVSQVVDAIPDSPSYNAIRVSIYLLENKGYLTHRTEGNKHIYRPIIQQEKASRTALGHLVQTYFGGSAPKAVSTLLQMSATDLSASELDELAAIIEKARKKGEG